MGKMQTLIKTTFLIALVFLLGAAASFGQPVGPPHQGPPPDRRLERDLEKLGLDAGQMERVRTILDAARKNRRARRMELRTAFEEMHQLLEGDNPDEAAVMSQVDKIGQIKIEQHKAMLRTLLEVRKQLTPEQREKLKEMGHRQGPPAWRRRNPGGGPGGW